MSSWQLEKARAKEVPFTWTRLCIEVKDYSRVRCKIINEKIYFLYLPLKVSNSGWIHRKDPVCSLHMKSIMMLLVFFSCSGIITFATFAKIWHPHIDVALSDRLLLPLAQSRPTSLSFRRVHLLLWNRQDSWPHTQKVAWKHFNVLVNLTSV